MTAWSLSTCIHNASRFNFDLWVSDIGIILWSGGAKVSCSLHHRGVQLILAYSWARPATLVAGKGRGGMFLFLLLLHFHSCSPFFPVLLFLLLYYLFSLFSLFLGDDTKWPTRVDVSLNPNSINQSISFCDHDGMTYISWPIKFDILYMDCSFLLYYNADWHQQVHQGWYYHCYFAVKLICTHWSTVSFMFTL